MKKQIKKLIKKFNNFKLDKFKRKFSQILDRNKLTFIDIGASIQIMQMEENTKNNLKYILFEPNKDEIKKLRLNKILFRLQNI